MGFPGGSVVKSLPADAGNHGFNLWVGKIPWRRKWQPTLVLLPGESHGHWSLEGCSSWGRKELDTAERLTHTHGFSSSHEQMWEFGHKEGWVPKNWFFQIVLEKTLESPCTARRSNQSIWKEFNPEYSLEGLMLKLKLQDFGHLMWRADSVEETLMPERLKARGEEGDRG